ncbi:MAG: glycosyltransferase family 39 protein [Candidatus Omnitrophota bacterium]|nr:glycosyltransferase family 39 protein [Candidatus Omnitrophota bacterium]
MINIYNALLIVLFVIIIIICNLLYLSRHIIKKEFKGVNKKTWLIIGFIFLIGLFLRVFIIPHMHNLYYDEDGYLDIAKHISAEGNNCLCLDNLKGVCKFCGYSLKSIGFSFLLAIFFKIFGTSHDVAFNVVAIFGSLTIFAVFFFLYTLFKEEKLALLGALILALYPLHLRWSGSASAEIVSLFFILLTFVSLIIYFRTSNLTILLTSILLLCFTITIKEENILLALFFLIPFLTKKAYRKKFLIIFLFFILIFIPYLVGNVLFHSTGEQENYAMRYTFWKQGNILSYDFFKGTFFHNMSFFLNQDYTPPIILFFNVLGIIFMFKKEKRLGFMFLAWLILLPALFSAYIGIPLELNEVRHYIPVILSIVVFSSYGIFQLCNNPFLKNIKLFYIITGIILISAIFYASYLTSDKSPVTTAQEDHDFIIQNLDKIPEDCLVITQESYLFDFFDKSATSIYLKDLNLKNKCLLYYKGELCYRIELGDTCREFEEKLGLESYLSNGRHTFYRIKSVIPK